MTPALDAREVFDDLLRQLDWLLPEAGDGEEAPEREYADVVADLLGFLAERMTELHRKRQAERSAFLAWLEERLGCPIDELAGKAAVRDYDAEPGGIDRLLRVIERNHPSKTSLDVSAPAEYSAVNPARQLIEQGYAKSMERLRPIQKQIALTDRLIDLIVYRLYGLTPAEIELVEGRSTP